MPETVGETGVSAPAAGIRSRLSRRLAINLVALAVTLAFCYVALRGIDFHEAWHGLRRSDWWWLLPALGAFALGNLARGLRWRSLFPRHRRPPRATTMNAMMIGYFYNNILPGRAGEAARVLVLTRRSDAPAVEVTSTVVLERLYDVVAVLLIFFVAVPWLPHVSWFGTAAIVTVALGVGIVLAAALLSVYEDKPVRLVLAPLRRFRAFSGHRLERTVTEVAHGLAGLRDWRVAVEALAWTLAAWLMSILCAYLVSRGFHLHLPFAASILVMVAIGVGMILPSPPAAVGVFEGATLIALQPYGLAHSVTLPYAVVLHLVNFVPFILVGAVLLQHNARHGRPRTLVGTAGPSLGG